MAVLFPAIHAATLPPCRRTRRSGAAWMAVTSTAMTDLERGFEHRFESKDVSKPTMISTGTMVQPARRGAMWLMTLLVTLATAPAHAEIIVPPPGAASCAGCHAARPGVETPVPRIAGRPAAEIVAALAAYRADPQKAGAIMNRIAKGFSPEESAVIAAWYARQKE